jgi:uncharacterized membrane protein YqaE (UPF0057 family)
MYLLALLVPPLAALACGKPFQALLCLALMFTLLGWIPAIIWACLIVSSHKADRRNQELIRALGGVPTGRATHRAFRLTR